MRKPADELEEWRKVPNCPERYRVSNLGRIKTLAYTDRRGWNRKEQILSPSNGEVVVTFPDGGKRWHALAAMILNAFVGPPPPGCYLSRHLDDNRKNNHISNLAWGNDADNHADAVRNGVNYASYGRLGKPHTQQTKKLLSRKLKGRKGRPMSDNHRKAMEEGYRKKFPKKPKPSTNPCACGCGGQTSPGKRYIHAHASRLKLLEINKSRIGKVRAW